MFLHLCVILFTGGWVSVQGRSLSGGRSLLGRPPCTVQSGRLGTHPTGMHSCFYQPQRSCGQGYVFTRVCDSVNKGRGAIPACIAGGIPACLAAGLQGVCAIPACIAGGGLVWGVCLGWGVPCLGGRGVAGLWACSGGGGVLVWWPSGSKWPLVWWPSGSKWSSDLRWPFGGGVEGYNRRPLHQKAIIEDHFQPEGHLQSEGHHTRRPYQ